MSVRVLKNSLWLTMAYVFGRGASLIWQLALARFFNAQAETYGQLTILISFAAIFMIVTEFGLNIAAQQEYSKRELTDNELLGTLLLLRAYMSVPIAVLFVAVIYFVYGAHQLFFAALPMSLYLLVSGQTQGVIGIWESRQEMKKTAALSVCQTALLILMQIIALKFFGTLFSLTVAIALSSFVALGIALIAVMRQLGAPRLPVYCERMIILKKYFYMGMPLMLASLIFVIYNRIDVIFLSKIVNDVAAGAYAIAAMLFMGIIDLIWSQSGKALFPTLAEKWYKNLIDSNFILKLQKFIWILFLLLMIYFILLLDFGEALFTLVFTADSPWRQAWMPLVVLSSGAWAVIIYSLFYRFLLLENKRQWYMYSSLLILAIKIPLAIFLIKSYQIAGAAFSNLICSILSMFLVLVALGDIRRKVLTPKLYLYFLISYLIVVFTRVFFFKNLPLLLITHFGIIVGLVYVLTVKSDILFWFTGTKKDILNKC